MAIPAEAGVAEGCKPSHFADVEKTFLIGNYF